MKRSIVALMGLLSWTLACGSVAYAQSADGYPSRVIKFVAPFPTGGTTDIVGRILAHKMSQSLGQNIIVENKVGASGAIGVMSVVQAPADGYTALIGASTAIVINPHVTQLSYDVMRDLRPVGLIMKAETLIVANPSKGLKSLADIVSYAKANPGKLTFGSVGIGSSAHLAMVHLQTASAVDLLHVPYRGAAQAELALVAGEVDLLVVNTVSALPHIEAGKMVPIALLSSMPSEVFPKLQAARDFIPDFVFDTWLALYVPAKTGDQIVNRLSAAMMEALKDPKLVQEFRSKGMEPSPTTSAELIAYQTSEGSRWGKSAASAKAKGWLN